MCRVGSKMASDKMSQWTKNLRGPDRCRRRLFLRRIRDDEGLSAQQPVSIGVGGESVCRFIERIAQNRSATATSRSASMKRRPESGVPKGEGVRGATKRSSYELQAASDKWVQVACRFVCMDVAFTWSFQLEACRSIAHHFSKGCTHKRQAIVLCRCPAARSALACGLGDRGEWSAPIGSGWCRK